MTPLLLPVLAAAAGLILGPIFDNATQPVGIASSTIPILSWKTRPRDAIVFDLALAVALALLVAKLTTAAIPYVLIAPIIAAAALIDHRTMRLPDALTKPLMALTATAVAIVAQTGLDTLHWRSAAIGALTAGIVLALPHLAAPKLLGRGDVKLAPTLGALTAWPHDQGIEGVLAAATAILIGLVSYLIVAAINRQARRQPGPLGPHLAVGALLAVTLAR